MQGMPAVKDRPDSSPLLRPEAGQYLDLFLAAIRLQTAPCPTDLRPPTSPEETLAGSSAGEAAGEATNRLLEAAREVFVAPLLYAVWPRLTEPRTVAEVSWREPLWDAAPQAREALRPLYYANAAHKAALLQLLEEIATVLESAGIRFLLLKGAALEAALDLPPALRVMADLDLLVLPGDLAAAEQALVKAGLVPTRDAENARLLRRQGYHASPYVAPHGGAVELHRRVLPRSAPFHLPPADLWRDSHTVCWRGHTLRVPSPEHLFLHTAIHSGFCHTHGSALRRLWDLRLVTSGMPSNRSSLMEAAVRCGARRLTEAALWEVATLHTEDPAAWQELRRRLCATDDFWTPHTPLSRLCERARGLDRPGQRLALWRYAVLPAREETANATGCASVAAHLRHFLHPQRLWRGVQAAVSSRHQD